MSGALKSIGAVVAGFVFILITHTVTDTILESLGYFPKPGEGKLTHATAAIALAYRTVFSIIGCYIAGALAPTRPMLHAMIIGIIGVVFSLLGLVVSIQMDLGPVWYPIALAVLSVPIAWIGGKLASKRSIQ